MVKIYFDPNFLFNELLDYYAPIIMKSKDKMLIDLHSLSIVNFLGLEPVQKKVVNIDELVLMSYSFLNSYIPDTVQLLEFSNRNLEKFKISNLISLKKLYYDNAPTKQLLRLENTLNNLEVILSLCNQYVIEHKDLFQDRKLEILLEVVTIAEVRKLSEEMKISFQMKQPFIFSFDFSEVDFETVYLFTEKMDRINSQLTAKVPEIHEYAIDKIKILDRLLTSVDRKSLTNVLFVFTSVDELISELSYLKNLIEEIEKL